MSLIVNHIASGSSGNAVMIDDGHSRLLFDAGIPYNKLAKFIRPSGLSAILITHEHLDHCEAAPELLRRGVRVFGSKGTKLALLERGMEVQEMEEIKHGEQIQVGSYYVRAFDVIHDAEEPLGFLYQSRVSGKGIYISDSAWIEYDFTGITHFVIECNYAEDLLENGDDPRFLKNRIQQSHFSFEKLQEFFRQSDLSKAEEIHLVHLSKRNADAKRFVSETQKTTGVPVYTI